MGNKKSLLPFFDSLENIDKAIVKKLQRIDINSDDYYYALKNRGDMTIWLSHDVIDEWYKKDRVYDGTGTPNLYSDMAILTVHEIRQVFKLPLRQCEGFINSLFK